MFNSKHLFITGAGRSGTTFLMRILNRSPSVHLTTEIHYFSSLFHDGFLKNLIRAKRKLKEFTIADLFELVQSRKHFGYYWPQTRDFSSDEVESFFAGKQLTSKNIYEYLLEHDVPTHVRRGMPPSYVGEKTPMNIFHVRRLFSWFSDCKILFIHRNPVDVLRSEVNKKYKPDYPLKKGNCLYSVGLVIFVFFEWLIGALIALYYKSARRSQFHIVSYENLVSHFQQTVLAISSVIDIQYTDDMCHVKKYGSSYSCRNKKEYWYPPTWLSSLFIAFLRPVHCLLNAVSLNNAEALRKRQ